MLLQSYKKGLDRTTYQTFREGHSNLPPHVHAIKDCKEHFNIHTTYANHDLLLPVSSKAFWMTVETKAF